MRLLGTVRSIRNSAFVRDSAVIRNSALFNESVFATDESTLVSGKNG